MGGVVARFERGPVTFEATEAIVGGQLVEARTASKVGVAAVGSKVVLGVATKDAIPASGQAALQVGNTGYSLPFTDTAVPTPYVPVDPMGFYVMTYAATATFGQRLVAAAAGQVAPETFTQTREVADLVTVSGSAVVNSAAGAQFAAADVGAAISGPGIPAGTTIISRQSATQATMSANATASATVTGEISGQPSGYRIGWCAEPAGVTGGATGLTRILV